MGYSVELYFDEQSEKKIRDLWKELHDLGISKFMHESGGRPHIALLVFDQDNCNLTLLKKTFSEFFKNKEGMELILSSLGIFPSEEGVTYLGIKPVAELLDLQEDYFNRIKDLTLMEQLWEYYIPDYWVPHCTMTMGTTAEEQLMAIDVLRKRFRNIKAKVDTVSIVEFYPYRVITELKLK